MELALFTFLWILWCATHSILISNTVTRFFRQKFQTRFRFYRVSYNLIALVTIIPLCLWQPTTPFFFWDNAFIAIRIIIFVIGGFLMLAGALQYDMLSLAGIRQLKEGISNEPGLERTELNYNGILGVIRHPWYLAAFMLIWTSNLGTAEVFRNGVLDCYLIIGAYLEERKLVTELGESYRSYQQQVPMMIPYKILKKRQ